MEGKKLRVSLFGKIEEKVNGRKWRMGENKFRILEKTSPILHSSFIIHHSSFIIFSVSTSPKFLRSPFFQTAKLLRIYVSGQSLK
ncbi:hypothetical protein AUK22_07060 [bacterium CG2_30_54_10]|nr:MAG: hypothetical protein AUK22_07060 [bacterium CG2_30_54_10]